ncbi:predicted protein [Uncinocarpus reesii 1704]|uniref:pH-response regulator protein palC n=1 Tax=Uncinocarpus reesii (strain UAMH 1704) TaxID=336963 RepID=C4JHJ9_UNCRE|nr:uncharacterized protein UREG_01362 [Uncinocarpus reesii 1704]EEP76513.1 predicted protein [Uncinocarpus reesii 1704]
MSAPDLHNCFLRPPIIQILRAAGFHSARPAVIDTLTDLAARYLLLLASSTVDHALNSHAEDPIPTLDDILMTFNDVGALRPQKTPLEEDLEGEDMRGLELFLAWFSGPANTEIRRIAGCIPSEGDVVDVEDMGKEDYLSALKKKHSKTGEESRFQGTVLGKDVEDRPVVIEGGIESIKAWGTQVRSREQTAEPASTTMSSMSRTMVFSFSLPTTSHLSFQSYLTSPTHPSLPSSASTARHALRLALKKHKALLPAQRPAHLPSILTALHEYLPYLFALSQGLSSNPGPEHEDIDVILRTEIEVAWRATLSAPASALHVLHRAAQGARLKGCGLDFEIAFVLFTLGYVLSLRARTRVLNTVYASATPTVEQKTAAAQAAMKDLLAASSVHTYLASAGLGAMTSEAGHGPSSAPVPDMDPSTQSALASLAMAEATLLAVLKDDAYLSACIQARNKDDTEWMIKAPDIPKVRALLFARLCVRAAEYSEQAAASAGAVKSGGSSSPDSSGAERRKLDENLVNYMRVLARVGRAKACRFLGIDAEMAGKVGEGIAWLRAGKSILGFKGSLEGDEEKSGSKVTGRMGFSKLKRQWSERREEKRLEESASGKKGEQAAGLDWGDDAGREEEGRVIEMLEAKWMKMNDTVNTQAIPSSAAYLSRLPSGRDIHPPPGPYVPPHLDADHLARMRAPPESPGFADVGDSSEEEVGETHSERRGGYF